MKKLLFMTALWLFLQMLASCGGNNDNTNDPEQAEIAMYSQKIIGTWELYEVNKGGSTTDFREPSSKSTVTFFPDGTYFNDATGIKSKWEMWYHRLYVGTVVYDISFGEGYSTMQLNHKRSSDQFIERYKRK